MGWNFLSSFWLLLVLVIHFHTLLLCLDFHLCFSFFNEWRHTRISIVLTSSIYSPFWISFEKPKIKNSVPLSEWEIPVLWRWNEICHKVMINTSVFFIIMKQFTWFPIGSTVSQQMSNEWMQWIVQFTIMFWFVMIFLSP